MKSRKFFSIFILMALIAFGCKNGSERSTDLNVQSQKDYDERLMQVHKEFVGNESKAIDRYTDSLEYDFIKSGTGLRYSIYQLGIGDTAKLGMLAGIKYKLNDMKGNVLYQSKAGEIQKFLIGKDNVESGLHEGIQKMTIGSKAIFVLPSHLAHGLSGDNKRIPPQTVLVYHIELISLE